MFRSFAKVFLVLSAGLTTVSQAADAVDQGSKLPKYAPNAQEIREAYERAEKFGSSTAGKVFQERINPHWFQNNAFFWYRNDNRGGTKEFILVEGDKGLRKPAFDHQKLADGLSKATGDKFTADKLPFGSIAFNSR
jgi:hypothetical protein